jgi:Fe-Mn family superoxide dismutase
MVKQIKLNYALGDLEPYIDKETMNIHYNKHHAAYTNNTTAILDELKIYSDNPKVVFKRASKNSGLRNNGGGWWNHNFFFEALNKPGLNKISSKFEELISENFGSYDKFVEDFSNAAATQFGSGWAWLGKNKDGSLEIYSTSNQDNCFMDVNKISSTPILCLDVWEHAYYLKYQNRRPEYVKNFYNVIDWSVVEERYNA